VVEISLLEMKHITRQRYLTLFEAIKYKLIRRKVAKEFPKQTMETFWLYYGNLLVASVYLPANSTKDQIFSKALDEHEIAPCCSHLYPEHNPGTIRNLIQHSEIRTFKKNKP
jgi:hypothetical protein